MFESFVAEYDYGAMFLSQFFAVHSLSAAISSCSLAFDLGPSLSLDEQNPMHRLQLAKPLSVFRAAPPRSNYSALSTVRQLG
jgi:hypothetical protein